MPLWLTWGRRAQSRPGAEAPRKLWMLHVSSLFLSHHFQTIWHVSGYGPSPGEPEVGCELQAPCSAPLARGSREVSVPHEGTFGPEDLLLFHQPANTWARFPGQRAPILSHHSSLHVLQSHGCVTAEPTRHTRPQTQLGNGREPLHGAATGEPRTQPRAEAASSSPSPSASNPAAVRLDGVFPLSRTGRALGAGRRQRRSTAGGTGPGPSGVNARGGLRQDGGTRSARGHRALRCAHRPAAPPP